MEKCGEELLDDMLNVTADIRKSNRRLSARLDEAINTSIIRPSVLDRNLNSGPAQGGRRWGGVRRRRTRKK